MTRIDPLSTILSPDLLAREVRLENYGSNAYAWTIDDGFAVVPAVGEASAIVLGGDFWVREFSGALHMTRDNWFFEPSGDRVVDSRSAVVTARRALTEASMQASDLLVELVCRL